MRSPLSAMALLFGLLGASILAAESAPARGAESVASDASEEDLIQLNFPANLEVKVLTVERLAHEECETMNRRQRRAG